MAVVSGSTPAWTLATDPLAFEAANSLLWMESVRCLWLAVSILTYEWLIVADTVDRFELR